MMKRLILVSMTAAAMSSVSSGVWAVNAGQIDFTGQIVTATCQIQGSPQAVPLGNRHLSEMDATNGRFPSTRFTVTLTNCPAKNGVRMQFMGTAAQGNAQLLAVNAPQGQNAAQNVGIRMFNVGGNNPLDLNTDTTPVNLNAGNNTVDFAAAYERIGNNAPVAGHANGSATLDITYN